MLRVNSDVIYLIMQRLDLKSIVHVCKTAPRLTEICRGPRFAKLIETKHKEREFVRTVFGRLVESETDYVYRPTPDQTLSVSYDAVDETILNMPTRDSRMQASILLKLFGEDRVKHDQDYIQLGMKPTEEDLEVVLARVYQLLNKN